MRCCSLKGAELLSSYFWLKWLFCENMVHMPCCCIYIQGPDYFIDIIGIIISRFYWAKFSSRISSFSVWCHWIPKKKKIYTFEWWNQDYLWRLFIIDPTKGNNLTLIGKVTAAASNSLHSQDLTKCNPYLLTLETGQNLPNRECQ